MFNRKGVFAMKQIEPILICSENCPHADSVDCARKSLPQKEEIGLLADVYKVFSDPTRLNIICALMTQELCVCDICELLDMNQSAVSHQLRVLKSAHLVKYRRQGKQIFYSLDDEHVHGILSLALEHIREPHESK